MKPLPAAVFAPLVADGKALAPDSIPMARKTPWQLLITSGRARFAGGMVVLLLLFAMVGPWLWPQDPAKQWLSHTSLGPRMGYEALLVDSRQPWQPADQSVAGQQVVEANTERVRLRWPHSEGLEFAVYRSERLESHHLGIPLGITDSPWFEDRLRLRSQPYRYTVVGRSQDREALRYEFRVEPVPAIGWFEAQLLGLIPVNAAAEGLLGKKVPIPAHPLGTDSLGRDLLSRLMHGARTSLFVGVVAPLIFIGLGTVVGAMSGLLGGRVDNWVMRAADFVIALPFLLFMILFRVAFGIGPGESGIFPMLVAMVLLIWPGSARLVRGQVLKLRHDAYVEAARLAGASQFYLIRRHILPNVLPVILVSLSFAIPMAIFLEAFLSFIGMGVSPPTPSWGSLCNDGIKTLLVYPHELVFPALMISIAVLSFNLLGESLRDAMDVKMQEGPL